MRNPYAPMEVLSADQIEAIHQTSLRILENLGIEVMSPRAIAVLAGAGAEVDSAAHTVRLDRGLVESALKRAPASFVLTPRNANRRVIMGENHINFGLVAGPPNVHDCERGRRAGNYRDYCDFIRLAQYFNAIHLIGNQVCAPIELPANTRHLDTYRANLLYSDRAYHCTAIGAGRALDGIRMMAIARGLTLEQMAASPAVMTIISVNSPRRFDEAMSEGLMAMAEHGQPVVVTPFTLMGAMAPVSLAAALAQQNAEALFGIVLAQAVRPGTPVMYGAFTSNVDMRSGAPAFGTPENAKANIASGQLARRYRLPYRTSNASASNAADAQGAYETEMSLWGAILGTRQPRVSRGRLAGRRAHRLIREAGARRRDAADDDRVPEAHRRRMRRSSASTPSRASRRAVISSASRTPCSVTSTHSTGRWSPTGRTTRTGSWRGARTRRTRATEIWKQALKEYEEPAMDPAVREALDAYVAERRADIGSGEP